MAKNRSQRMFPLGLLAMSLLGQSMFAAPPAAPVARATPAAPAVSATKTAPKSADPLLPSIRPDFTANLASFTSENEAALQIKLPCTNEEWSVIFPKLLRLAALRDEVNASPGAAPSNQANLWGGILNAPLGGNSLDVPVMGNGRGMPAAKRNPFDPNDAPGSPAKGTPLLLALFGDGVGKAFGNMFKVGQGNSVATYLTELRSLVAEPSATLPQLKDKLNEVYAARRHALRDLSEAQKDLLPLLTLRQQATLVTLGYLD